MTYVEGDYCRHRLDPELLLCVVRVESGWITPVLVVRDASGVFDPSHTFKVEANMVTKAIPPHELVS